MTTAYLALGSNLGDRQAALEAAVAALARTPGVEITAASPAYETAAVADEPQPPYLNAVVRLETTLAPRALLEAALGIERAMGRVRPAGRAKAPRLIDIDLLLWGDSCVDEPGLVVPHPALLERAFVRVPLAAVAAPGLRHPVTGDELGSHAAPADGELRVVEGLRLGPAIIEKP